MKTSHTLFSLLMVSAGLIFFVFAMGQAKSRSAPVDYPPGREPMTLPDDYRSRFVHYATVDRIDGIIRYLYINPAALDAVRAGDALPDYTVVVIEAFAAKQDGDGQFVRTDGRFVRGRLDPEIHVAEKRSTWLIEDLAASSRVGDWNFGAFDFESGTVMGEVPLSDCFSCHESANRREFVFSLALLRDYVETGEVQYRYCPAPDRIQCRF